MNRILKWFSYLFFWLLLEMKFSTQTIVQGIIISTIVLALTEKIFKKTNIMQVKGQPFWRMIWFFFIVVLEMLKAAFQHILRIIAGDDEPVIIEVDLNVRDEFVISLISNAITLTPGTITIKVDRNRLTILGFAKNEFEKKQIKYTILNKFQKPFKENKI